MAGALSAFIRKASYITREEGILGFLDRARRAAIVRVRRQFRDTTANQKRWRELKGRYAGQRAFLIGNGPSLNRTPLHLLVGEYTMCFNRFNLMFERIAWRPTMFSIIDDRVLRDMTVEVDEIVREVEHAFFPDLHPYNIDFTALLTPSENINWLYLDRLTFSVDLPWCGINKTVANVGLQVLAHLGFSEIYLLGVDMEYAAQQSVTKHSARDVTAQADDDPNHFDPRYFGAGRAYHNPRLEETLEKFVEGRAFFDQLGVKVMNAGIGGRLEVFPRIEFRSLFRISELEELDLLLRPLGRSAFGEKLEDAFPAAIVLGPAEAWPTGATEVICELDDAVNHLRQVIIEYLPLGPYQGKYVFLRRPSQLAP